MARVLLTGASGFIGRQIHRSLVAQGHGVTLVLREGAKDRLAVAVTPDQIIATQDLFAESREWWESRCRGIDVVIHAAWYVEPGKYLDSPRNMDCVSGSIELARGAVAAGVSHFIGLGTCMEYALPSDHLDIEAPLLPVTLYAAAKLSLFQILTQYLAPTDCRFSWCRLFYLFGEGEHPSRLVPYVRAQLEKGEVAKLSAGTQLRDYLDVRIAGDMIAAVADTGQMGPVNVCSGKATTIRGFVETIADEYGRRDLLEFGTAAIHPRDPAAVVGVCNAVAR